MEKTSNNDIQTNKKITLHDMRKQSGKSGATIARLCNTTYHSLRNWEKGKTIPNVVNIYDLLQVYGYTFYELDMDPFFAEFNNKIRLKTIKEEDALNLDRLKHASETKE